MGGDEMILTPNEAVHKLAAKQIKDGYVLSAIHHYRDIDGNIIYSRIRLEHFEKGKWIRPMYQDKNYDYHLCEPPELKEAKKPLYGLDLLYKYRDAFVLVVEGEKCADFLNNFFSLHNVSTQYIAVTSGGATSDDRTDWEALRERDISIWPDNDAEGRNYANRVCDKLQKLSCSPAIIDISGFCLPDGGDCVDYMESHKEITADELIGQLVEIPTTSCESKKDDMEHIRELATLEPIEYDKKRIAAAKKLGVRSATLDKQVDEHKKEHQTQSSICLQEVTPWNAPINPLELLEEMLSIVFRYVICELYTAVATVLWCVMTWYMEAIQIAPLAVITAPEKRCGKTTLLTIMRRFVKKALAAGNISPAALFRTIDALSPTLLIDEADAFMRGNEDIRCLLNCGHNRDGAFVMRVVGENHEPKSFSVWGAKAIAGIGSLAETLMDRAIILKLRRKHNNESVERLRQSESEMFAEITSKLARLSQDTSEQIKSARPFVPEELNDRAKDNWEPLLAIADLAGGRWPEIARNAALKLTPEDSVNIGFQLLMDIRRIFKERKLDRIPTIFMIDILCEDDEKIWVTFNKGKPISAFQLAANLKEYGISSKTIRIDLGTKKGYLLADFEDAFARYLPSWNDVANDVTT